MKFKIYSGECQVECEETQEKKDALFRKIIYFCAEHDCISGESLQQCDSCLLDAPDVLAEIIDEIMLFKSEWDTEE